MRDVAHPTYDGRPVQLGDWIKISNAYAREWQQVSCIRWNGAESMVWIHAGDGERQSAECIVAEPTDGYSHIVALRTPLEVAALRELVERAAPDA